MRVIFLLLLSSIAFQSNSQTWNNYLQKRFKSYGIWADSILLLPSDTTINKAAKSLAVKNGNLYIANGNYWTEISGGISKTHADYGLQNVNDSTLKVDSSLIATREGLYKVSDSISNKFNNYLPLTGGNITGNVTANSFIKSGGTASQFLKADGSVDTTAYATLTSLSATAPLSYNNSTGVFSLTSGYIIPTTTQETDWNTAFTNRITSLTTTGASGAATLISNTLNIPQYTLSGLGGDNASNITSGTLSDSRLSSNVPKMVSNVLPAVDGSLLTNLNPASIATVIQTITATATINNSTTTLLVNPATVVSSLSITFCAAPYQNQIIRIVFGGTITSGNQVVTTLSILPNSGQSVVRKFPSVEAFAGDFLAFQYINTNWYQIN